MSATWTQTSANQSSGGYQSIDYFADLMIYTVTTTWHVTGCAIVDIPGTIPGDDTYPSSVEVTHNGLDILDEPYSQLVYCWPAELPAVLTSPTADGVVEVRIIYRGRVCGFHKLVPSRIDRTITRQYDLIIRLDDAQGTHTGIAGQPYNPGIGVDYAGYEIRCPVLMTGLLLVIPTQNLESTLQNIQQVTPSANEAGWVPPWSLDAYPAGARLCCGYSNVVSDLITRTTELNIDFEYDSLKPYGQHMWWWRVATDVAVNFEHTRNFKNDLEKSQVYELAGSPNLTLGAGTNPTFADNVTGCFAFNTLSSPDGNDTPQRLLVR